MTLQYKNIIWAEMFPDLYDGEYCDQIKPRWKVRSDGDMGSEFMNKLTLTALQFPAGAKVTISLPCCPKCGQDVECCKTDDSCDFDWEEWVSNEYS